MELILTPSNYFFNAHAIPFFISGTLIMAEAVFVFFQNRRAMLNVSFAGIAFFCGIWLTGIGFIYSSANEPTAYIWSRYYDWLGIIFITPFVYLFSTALGREPSEKKIRFAYFNFAVALGVYIFCVLTDDFIVGVWSYPWGYYPRGSVAEGIFIVWFYTLMTLSFCNFVSDLKREKLVFRKKQLKYVITAFVFGFIGSLDFIANFGVPLYTIGSGALFIFSTMIAYTIVNYKLMDIETVIHKTILWILSFAIITVPLAVVYAWFYPFAKDSLALQIMFGTACFVVVTVYMRLYQPKIDHFFQRRKANLEEISNHFVENLVHLKGLDNLIRYIEETIDNTMYANWIDIFIIDEDKNTFVLSNKKQVKHRITEFSQEDPFLAWLKTNNKIVYGDFIETDPAYDEIKEAADTYFKSTQATVAIPLILNEQLLGLINLSRKTNLKRYNSVDFNFLTTLKNQAAIAISNSLIYQNIEEQVKKRTEELVAVQKQLTQAEKLATVGTLSGGVAHEINNPLTAILTSVQMLLSCSDGDEAEVDRETLELIEEATQRCRTIVQKLMTYAKKPLETEGISKIDLNDVLEKVISFLGYQLEQEDIKITTKVEKTEYPIMGNQNELEQVLTNIVLNARDSIIHSKKKGSIHILLSRDKDCFKIEIKDDGEGIPEDVIPKIFDPFFTTKDVGKGLGLGLSICQSIIEKHNGKIYVESSLGQGSTFVVELPQYNEVMEPCNASL